MKVLDLDMDYFMTDVAHTNIYSSCRLPEEDYGCEVWPATKVRSYLENNLGLSKEHKINGRIVKGHDESLYFWEELMKKGMLEEPFAVVHVDSHADLGNGFLSYRFLQSNFLKLPISERRKINTYIWEGKKRYINIADYLLWAIGYNMISTVTYCANPNSYISKNDFVWHIMKDFHYEIVDTKPVKLYIQLKYNEKMDLFIHNPSSKYLESYLEGAIKDPEVEFLIIPTIEDVQFNGDFDYAVLAQSPNYTPASADFIMDIFREYINEI